MGRISKILFGITVAAVTIAIVLSWSRNGDRELDVPIGQADSLSTTHADETPPIRGPNKQSLPVQNLHNVPTDQAVEITEIVESAFSRGQDYRSQAYIAAEEALKDVEPEAMLRWEPVYIDPGKIVAGKFVGEDAESDSRTPREEIVISPFPDVSFEVSMRDFDDVGWGASWIGDIAGPSGGTVTFHLSPDEHGRTVLQGYIVTDTRNYNLTPTSTFGHYVAVEMNPSFSRRVD